MFCSKAFCSNFKSLNVQLLFDRSSLFLNGDVSSNKGPQVPCFPKNNKYTVWRLVLKLIKLIFGIFRTKFSLNNFRIQSTIGNLFQLNSTLVFQLFTCLGRQGTMVKFLNNFYPIRSISFNYQTFVAKFKKLKMLTLNPFPVRSKRLGRSPLMAPFFY